MLKSVLVVVFLFFKKYRLLIKLCISYEIINCVCMNLEK